MEHPSDAVSAEPTQRLRLTVAYDGLPFRGWQSQTNGDAIQDRLEAAFAPLCEGRRIVVHGSGRTDAGVHARGQVAHADVPCGRQRPCDQWRAALNAHLPATIRVLTVRLAAADFHARFAAQGKIYRYRIWNDAVLNPFEVGRAWHLPGRVNMEVLEQTSRLLIGRHDFAGFAANRGEPSKSTERTIQRITLRRRAALLTLDFEGDGFLYKMVRLLTGSLVRCAQGKASAEWIAALLAGRVGKTNFAAPAEGLYLMKVLYGGKPGVTQGVGAGAPDAGPTVA